MEALSQFATPLSAALAVFVVHFLSSGRFRALEQRSDRNERRIDELSKEMNTRFDQLAREVNSRFDAVRSDLTQIALALGVRREPEAG